ncbi:6065_t:CDS:2 [Cetraspora pellucida]|uniref:6065_t:CDS:1 n=1 Tax=Cetraspora pellucida TaxID=1433469 RepID=A0A9N9AYP6_9GLOM|nr:6065_t:CDS:2 [Cetraspora pellucida]
MKFWDSVGYGDQGTMDESSPFDGLFKLSRMERLYGFGICTGFLVGFTKQMRTMFAPVQVIYLMADPSLKNYVAVVLRVLYNNDTVFVILE